MIHTGQIFIKLPIGMSKTQTFIEIPFFLLFEYFTQSSSSKSFPQDKSYHISYVGIIRCGYAFIIMRIRDPKNVHMDTDPDPRG